MIDDCHYNIFIFYLGSMKLVSLHHANDGKHKFVAKISDDIKVHSVLFGAKGYSDFTMNKDPEKKERYIARHKSREDWTSTGILTPGFWSRWVLWNKPSLTASVKDVITKFHL